MKALVVEPSRMVSSILTALFARHDIDALTVATGQDGLAALEDGSVDLLCFAYELGDMNGVDFFVRARARKLIRQQPALLFAATHDKAVVSRAIEAGVTECFAKRHFAQLDQFVEKFATTRRALLAARVLLVEDSTAMALFYTQVMTRMGLTVDVCESAELAIKHFDSHTYDIVVTDYMLAGTETGFAVIRAVRATPGRKADTPIVVISGFDDTARKIEVLRNGANDFIAKPVVAEELEMRITNLITVRQLMRKLDSQHEAMKTMAMHDQLTSLYNRYFLEIKASALIETAHAAGTPLALLVVDLDHFKQINDTHGHKAGDHVLESVANAMRRFARANDVVARIGGEEFVVVMPGLAPGEAAARADELRESIGAQCPMNLDVTCSIGVAGLAAGDDYDDLFRRADAAAYRAKDAGRNRTVAAS